MLIRRLYSTTWSPRAWNAISNSNKIHTHTRSLHTIKKTLESGPGLHSVQGWVRSVRKLKNVAFIDLSDGSGANIMAVLSRPDYARDIMTGTCVKLSGNLVPSPGAGQSYELQITDDKDIKILGESSADYPLQKKYHSPEFLRTIPQFRWKTVGNSAILRLRSQIQSQISKYYESQDFVQVNSPIMTSSDCEGAGEVFTVMVPGSDIDFFGKKSYLSVSSQLHLEVYAASLGRVWNIAPAFRAEKSDTNRHLSEFWMVEAELAFTESLEDVMSSCEGMVRATIPDETTGQDLLNSLRDKNRTQVIEQRWANLHNNGQKWPRITYKEALKILDNVPSTVASLRPTNWTEGLGSEHEKYLAGQVFKGPVFITDYPVEQKPFYMKRSPDKNDDMAPTVECFDLLVPEMGELTGGSLREDDYQRLISRMIALGMDVDCMQWYTDLRKYGSFPHGGYGLGLERLVCYLGGIENIRDAIGFPRWHQSCLC